MNIQKFPLDQLVPDPNNPRVDLKPGDKEYDAIKASILEFDAVEPLIFNKRSGYLISGHQRLKVLKELGFSEIETVVVDLDPRQQKKLNLAMNKISGRWDELKLPNLLEELCKELDSDLVSTGFTLPEIGQILDGLDKSDLDDFDADAAAESIIEPVTKRGDVLRLGDHIIMCGDSGNPDDLKTLMGSDKANLMPTDISYKVSYGKKNNRPGSSARSIKEREANQICNDDMPQADYEIWMRKIFTAVKEFLKDGAVIYLWQGHRQIPPLYQILLDLGFHVSSLICWLKESPSISFADYSFQSEHALYGWKLGAPHYWAGPPCASNVWEVKRDDRRKYFHPTQKPVQLSINAITNSSKRGDIVFDPFLGGAGLLLACETLGRKCRGMDVDPRFLDVAVFRYAGLVGWDKLSPEIRVRYMKEVSHAE